MALVSSGARRNTLIVNGVCEWVGVGGSWMSRRGSGSCWPSGSARSRRVGRWGSPARPGIGGDWSRSDSGSTRRSLLVPVPVDVRGSRSSSSAAEWDVAAVRSGLDDRSVPRGVGLYR